MKTWLKYHRPVDTRRSHLRRLSVGIVGPLLVPLMLCGCSVLQSMGLLTTSQRVATPVISPAGGSYSSDQSVTISDQTNGATIYYTTDGSTPSTGSQRYSTAITVGGNGEHITIRAIAVKSGLLASPIVATSFEIQYAKTAPIQTASPSFTPAPGSYSSDQTVSISDSTAGATIYYTTDGSAPTTGSPQYSSPISVSGDGTKMTIHAVAVAAGDVESPVVLAAYQISYNQAATPSFTPAAGSSSVDLNSPGVSIASATSGASIYYTESSGTITSPPTPPSTPTTSSTHYRAPIVVAGDRSEVIIKAVAVKAGMATSGVATASFTIDYSTASTPQFSIAGGEYSADQSVAISDSTSGAVIHYTTDGSLPTASSPSYPSTPVSIAGNATVETLRAMAVAPGYKDSSVETATYAISYAHAPAPTFTPAGGSYGANQSVRLSDADSAAVIHYTADGTVPSSHSAVFTPGSTAAISVSGDGTVETVNAIAVESGKADSPVASATYSISYGSTTLAPTLSVAAGEYSTNIDGAGGDPGPVTMSDGTANAVIYYTTDGSTPTTSSSVYTPGTTAPISITGDGSTETITAMAVAPGLKESPITQATYTIHYPVAAPTFSVAAGTHTTNQSVSLADTTAGAVIHYTTDGTVPSSHSAVFTPGSTAAISVSGDGTVETVNAIAVDPSGVRPDSPVASATYSISYGSTTLAPSLSLAGGEYSTNIDGVPGDLEPVTISDGTANAVIYYTTDGSTPTTSSSVYTPGTTAPISITGDGSTETITAMAAAPGLKESPITQATYTIHDPVAAPIFSLPAGTYDTGKTVSLVDSNLSAVIHYTTNGTVPTASSPVFSGTPISVNGDGTVETINAIAVDPSGVKPNSTVASATYTITYPSASFSVPPGSYTSALSVTITPSPVAATVYYTTDGSTPTTSSTPYSGPITVSGPDTTETIEAIAVVSGGSPAVSPVESATYAVRYRYQLSVISGADGTATPTSTQTADYGAATVITATPNSGYSFGYWVIISGTGAFLTNASSATTTVQLSTNATVQAIFTGNITTVAGDGTSGFSGDGGAATAAELNHPNYVSISPTSGNLYISDNGNQRIRKVTVSTGDISTVAGTGTAGYSGPSSSPTKAELDNPDGVFANGGGIILIADQSNQRIRTVVPLPGTAIAPGAIIGTLAGNGTAGYAGDGGPYSGGKVEFHNPFDVAMDPTRRYTYIADTGNNVIREIGSTIITTIAGDGTAGYAGDGGPATSAEFNAPVAIAVDSSGNLYIADSGNNVIREVTMTNGVPGNVKTVAGNGYAGFSGDGGPATSAELSDPVGVAVDSSGNIYISDRGNNRIREVNAATGIISTIAGDGTAGYSGDGGGALSAELNQPGGLAIDSAGNLYVADTFNNVIRVFPTTNARAN